MDSATEQEARVVQSLEQLQTWQAGPAREERRIWFEEDDVWFDITDTIEPKIAALNEHKTQMNGAEKNQAIEFVRWIGKYMAKGRGIEYAETFKYLRLE